MTRDEVGDHIREAPRSTQAVEWGRGCPEFSRIPNATWSLLGALNGVYRGRLADLTGLGEVGRVRHVVGSLQ